MLSNIYAHGCSNIAYTLRRLLTVFLLPTLAFFILYLEKNIIKLNFEQKINVFKRTQHSKGLD